MDTGLDLLLGVETSQLAFYCHERRAHALLIVERFEKRLLILGRQLEVERYQIRECPRLVHALDQLVECLGRHTASGSQLGCAVPQLLIESLKGRIVDVRVRLTVHLEENRPQHLLTLGLIGDRLGAALPLDEQLHSTPDSVSLDDSHHRPDVVQQVGMWVVDVLPLGHRKQPAVAVQSLLNRLDRTGSPSGYRNRHARIYDGVAKRQNR